MQHYQTSSSSNWFTSWLHNLDSSFLTSILKMMRFFYSIYFKIVEHEPSENFTLQIKFAQLRDSGVCI